VRASAAVVADAGPDGRTRLPVLRSVAPLVLRPTAAGLYLAAGAAGPLGGDDLELSIAVGPHAALTLRTVGATVALPGPGESRLTLRISVAAGGRLAVLPEPTVVANGARHVARTYAEVEDGGELTVREEVVLGRYGEGGGSWSGLLHADVAGRPLLRHRLDLAGTPRPGSLLGARAVGTVLHVGPRWSDVPAGADPDRAVLPLAGPGVLHTAMAGEAATLRALLDRAVRPG
jgi:urease accessory protein